MTEKSRRRLMLEQSLAEDPADSFLRYGLAIQCLSEGDVEEGRDRLKALIADRPEDQVAAYQQLGQSYAQTGETDAAVAVLTGGHREGAGCGRRARGGRDGGAAPDAGLNVLGSLNSFCRSVESTVSPYTILTCGRRGQICQGGRGRAGLSVREHGLTPGSSMTIWTSKTCRTAATALVAEPGFLGVSPAVAVSTSRFRTAFCLAPAAAGTGRRGGAAGDLPPLVVTDPGLVAVGLTAPVAGPLGKQAVVFSDVSANPAGRRCFGRPGTLSNAGL